MCKVSLTSLEKNQVLNIHRDIPVSAESVIDRFSKTKTRYLDFII